MPNNVIKISFFSAFTQAHLSLSTEVTDFGTLVRKCLNRGIYGECVWSIPLYGAFIY